MNTKMLRNKWVLLGLFSVLIGAVSLFFWRVTSQGESPAPARQKVVQDNPDHELKELSVQIQKKPGHTPILMRMAQIEHDQGKLADAAGHLREVVKNEPNNAEAHLDLGRVLYEKGDWPEAISETEKAIAVDPKQVDALYNLGAIYANAGNTERARSYWKTAMDTAPQSDSGKKARDSLTRLQATGAKR
jgi:tetratricopeptide (TPR) repeat protein